MNRIYLILLLLSFQAVLKGQDTIPPFIFCPLTDTVTLGPGGICTFQYFYAVVSGDDEPGDTLVQLSGLASGSGFPIGNTVNLFQATDAAGNTSTCSFTLTVQQYFGVISCKSNVQVSIGSNCTWDADVAFFLSGNYGCPDGYIVELDKNHPLGNGPWEPAVFGAADIDKTYAFRVTDTIAGNNCLGNVTVSDFLPPTLTCDSITVPCVAANVSPYFMRDSLGIGNAVPAVSDNCSPNESLNLFNTDASIPLDCASDLTGYIRRRWTAQDNFGNSSTCEQIISLTRIQMDDVQLPPDVTVDCSGAGLSPAETGEPYYEYAGRKFTNLCSIGYTHSDSITSSSPCARNILRHWTILNWCTGSTIDFFQNIESEDKAGPLFEECPANVTVTANTANCQAEVVLPEVVVADGCSNIASVIAVWKINNLADTLEGKLAPIGGNASEVRVSFDTISEFPLGITGVTYWATDSCGNTTKCDISLHVWDGTPPTADCPENITVNLTADGTTSISAQSLNTGSTDDCGTLYFKVQRNDPDPPCGGANELDDTTLLCCADIGKTIILMLKVYDVFVPAGPVSADYGDGQSAICFVQASIVDNNPPRCDLPPDVTVTCENFDPTLESYGDAEFSCNVDSVELLAGYDLFDTICSRGTITRIYRVFDTNSGQNAQCSQSIVVTYQQDYYIRFPDDAVVEGCNDSSDYGVPLFFGVDCESMSMTYEDIEIPDPQGYCRIIERHWTIINWCDYNPNLPITDVPNPEPDSAANNPDNLAGPIVSAPGTAAPWAPTVINVNFDDPEPTDYSTFWSLTTNGYRYKQFIKIIDNQVPTIDDCHPTALMFGDTSVNDTLLWNGGNWFDPQTNRPDLCEGMAPLSLTATDLCTDTAVTMRYLLFLDLDNDTVHETVINSEDPPAPGTVNFGNAANPNYSGGESRAFDNRPVDAAEKYRFALQTTVSGKKKTGHVVWNSEANPDQFAVPELPYGSHKIEWTVTDDCGNQTTCEYSFVVKDARPPEVTCNPFSLTIFDNAPVTLQVSNILQIATDNHTPPDLLVFGLKKGGGPDFPTETSLEFNCADLGNNSVQLWAMDLAGNTNFCTAQVTVLVGDTSCQNINFDVAGQLTTELGAAVAQATILLTVSPPPTNLSTDNDPQGFYQFKSAVPLNGDYSVMPVKNINHFNGVSTADLLLISRHILAIDPLGSPYKMIAADANKSNSITTFDIVELRKLILGIYDELPANTSWRFVDKNFDFPNPENPFETPFPESISRDNVSVSHTNEDFVGVKVGDVNNSASGDSLLTSDDRWDTTLFFDVNNRTVQAGEVLSIPFRPAAALLGYQFTLDFHHLELLEVVPGEGISLANFGVFEDALTTSVEHGAQAFSVVFRARKAGQLSDMLSISSRITRAEGYELEEGDSHNAFNYANIALRFDDGTNVRPGFALYQNRPNPFDAHTLIGFQLPEACEATLRIFDETGRLLHTLSAHYPRGYNAIRLDRHLVEAKGVLYYKLETPTESAVRKMVVLR